MQTKFSKYFSYTLLIILLCVTSAGMLFTSCDKDEEGDNGTTVLNSFGPMPVARGAELRFIGKNLDKVTAVILPGSIEIPASQFVTISGTLFTITVPQNAVEGKITLVTPDGNIETKTELGFSEPISISDYAPAVIKADSILTINGDYLNLVHEIIFTDRVAIGDTDFIVHTRYQIQLPVPASAQTGKFAVSNGNEDPIIVYSANMLTVKLPVISSVSPNPVKAGTQLTIAGDHLDLVKTIILGGNTNVTSFDVSESHTELTLTVPATTKDGTVILQPASLVNVESATPLVMVVPSNMVVAPTTLKNGEDITVTGTNLDLIDRVIFGGSKQGVIKAGGTATQIVVTVPDDAITGVVQFITKAEKTVNGPSITMTDPIFTSFAPSSAKANTDIVITGTDLDLVTEVIFTGNMKGTIGARTLTSLTVTVPVGAKSGIITLKTKNGSLIESATEFTALANLPVITSFTEPKGTPGQILTINGTNMLLIKELVFPGNVKATAYGLKSDTKVEVYVPEGIVTGYGKITLITYEGEEGLSPEIFLGSTDLITASTIMISNFDGGGASQSTWGGVVTFGTPSINLNGTACMLGLTGSGWQWTWSHNWDTRPALAHPENYVIKIDICITTPAAGVDAGLLLKGWDTTVSLGQPFASSTNGKWITLTFDVLNAGMSIDGTGDWGIWINGGSYNLTGVMVDNLRFDPK